MIQPSDLPGPDEINWPKHYNSHPSGIQSIDVCEHYWFNLSCASKYIWRAGLKNPKSPEIDLKKAWWYLKREESRLQSCLTKNNLNKFPYSDRRDGEHPNLSQEELKEVIYGFDYPFSHVMWMLISFNINPIYNRSKDYQLLVDCMRITAALLEKHINNNYQYDQKLSDSLVNHPKHYNSHPSGIEAIDLVEGFRCNIGNAIKYIWRQGLKEKSNSKRDLEKSIWYIDREIQRIETHGMYLLYPFTHSTHFSLDDQQLRKIIHGFDNQNICDAMQHLCLVGLGRTAYPIENLKTVKMRVSKLV